MTVIGSGCTELDPLWAADEGGASGTGSTSFGSSSTGGAETTSSTESGSTTGIDPTESTSTSTTAAVKLDLPIPDLPLPPVDLLPCDDVVAEDDFEDGQFPELWLLPWGTNVGEIVEQNGALEWGVVPGRTDNKGVRFGGEREDLSMAQLTIELDPVLSDPGFAFYFEITGSGCGIHFRIENGVIQVKNLNETRDIYNPISHRWLRIRSTGTGTFAFDAAPEREENRPLEWEEWGQLPCAGLDAQVQVITTASSQTANAGVVAIDRFQHCRLTAE